jgi:hypothetical protein
VNGFFQTYLDLLESIDDSIKKERIVPGLILLYSSIDSFSSLAEISNGTGRKIFKDWVKKWMLDRYPLPCNETDIYSARCGLLHQQISESDLTASKKAREIYYVWGNASAKFLQDTIDNSNKKDTVVAVKIEDLVWAFRRGMADCMDDINKDRQWRMTFDEKAKKIFVSVNHSV